jgi:hypothetical protein
VTGAGCIVKGRARSACRHRVARCGWWQVPYIEDPNTKVKSFESAEIIDYLRRTYQVAA